MGDKATWPIPWDLKGLLTRALSISDPQAENKGTQTQDKVPDSKGKKNPKTNLDIVEKNNKSGASPEFLNLGAVELKE